MSKMTIVKVVSTDYKMPVDDIERWKEIFEKKLLSHEAAVATGEVEISELDRPEGSIVLVKIGDEDFKPTFADLEAWRSVFEEAQKDKDFMIFTHSAIDVSVIPISLDSVIKVEPTAEENKLNHMEELIINQIK